MKRPIILLMAIGVLLISVSCKTPKPIPKPPDKPDNRKWIEKELGVKYEEGNSEQKIRFLKSIPYSGPVDRPSVGWILSGLRDDDITVREQAFYTVQHLRKKIKPHLLELLKTLKDDSEFSNYRVASLRGRLIYWLHKLDESNKQAVKFYRTKLSHGRWVFRFEAAKALAYYGAHAEEAYLILKEALLNHDQKSSMSAVYFIGKLGEPVAEDVIEMYKAARDPSSPMQIPLLHILRGLGPAGREAIPMLIDDIKDSSGVYNFCVVRALASMGEHAHEAVPAIAEASLNADGDLIKVEAIYALGCIGPRAKDALPVVISHIKSDVHHHKYAALQAIGRIAPKDATAIEAVNSVLESGDDMDKAYSLFALALLTRDMEKYVGELFKYVTHSDHRIDRLATRLMCDLGEEAIPHLKALMKKPVVYHQTRLTLLIRDIERIVSGDEYGLKSKD